MSIEHHVLTLSGSAERLSDLLTDPAVGGRDDLPLRTISLQPRGTNANPIYLGATSVVSATDYGVRLEPGTGGIPPAPWILGEHDAGPLKLSNFYVIGTATQHLHIMTVPF